MGTFDIAAQTAKIDAAKKAKTISAQNAVSLRNLLGMVKSGAIKATTYEETATAMFALPVAAPSVEQIESLRKCAGWTPDFEAKYRTIETYVGEIDALVKASNVKVRFMMHTRDYKKVCGPLGYTPEGAAAPAAVSGTVEGATAAPSADQSPAPSAAPVAESAPAVVEPVAAAPGGKKGNKK